jgi:mRNA-degrading endonuclease toxin of MazEF toxin-antitoxin module
MTYILDPIFDPDKEEQRNAISTVVVSRDKANRVASTTTARGILVKRRNEPFALLVIRYNETIR